MRAWHEGWWETGRRDRRPAGADARACRPARSPCTRTPPSPRPIVGSCFSFDGRRRKILLQDLDFPTNHYLFEGFRRFGAEVDLRPIRRFRSGRRSTGWWTAIDDQTALVPMSLVLFRSACLQDVAAGRWSGASSRRPCVPRRVPGRRRGADDLAALGVDFAVGGSVKWLCGGPGAGYLYVRPDLIGELRPSFVGWAGHASPFELRDRASPLRSRHRALPERHAERARRWYRPRAGYEIVGEIGVAAIRARSLQLTRRLIDGAKARGWRLNTPAADTERGGSVVIDVPEWRRP